MVVFTANKQLPNKQYRQPGNLAMGVCVGYNLSLQLCTLHDERVSLCTVNTHPAIGCANVLFDEHLVFYFYELIAFAYEI